VADGIVFETCPDAWQLEGGEQGGEITLELENAQEIAAIEILNTRGGPASDRATKDLRVIAYNHSETVMDRSMPIPRFPYWAQMPLPDAAGPIDRVTVRIESFTGAGGGLNEIRLRKGNAASLPHLGVGQALAFTDGQNQNSLLSGWSGPEPGGVWSEGHAAYLGFVVNGAAVLKEAIVHARVFVLPGKLNQQHVQVWSGGRKLVEYDLKDENAQFTIPLDGLTIKNDTPVILGFYLPAARAPQQLDMNDDPRLIAISIQSLQLVASNDAIQNPTQLEEPALDQRHSHEIYKKDR
jgi:hypothetical protein